MIMNMLTANEIESFRSNGFIVIKQFYPQALVEEVRREIYEIIGLIAEDAGHYLQREVYSPENFDAGLPDLLSKDRRLVGIVYDAVKKIPSYVKLACDERHESVGKKLLGTEKIGFCPRGYGIRMDNPQEHHYATQLHQDYTSQLSSTSGLVFWSPLRRVTPELGRLKIMPGSSKEGICKIKKVSDGSAGLILSEEERFRREYAIIEADTDVGDCLIADFLVLHESSPNLSKHTRWSMISRYFDLLHPSGRSIGWKGGLAEGNSFERVHPELVTN